MTLQEFLKEILPTTGTYYTAQQTTSGKNLRQWPHDTIEDAAADLGAIVKRKNHAFIATGSFDGGRKQDQCKFKRAWYVDIDCKEGGQYPDKDAAKKAIKAALLAGLPPFSILVDTGNGYHPYWICTEDVPRKDWKAEAKILTKACAATKLKIDSAVTEDEARILRVPESVNYKDPTHPKQCRVIQDTGIRYTYDEFVEKMDQWRSVGTPQLSAAGQAMGALVDAEDLYGGRDKNKKPAEALEMISRCKVFENSWKTHGKDDSEPLWHQLLYTLTFCDDGDQFYHPISDGHPDYTPGKINGKVAFALQSKKKNPELGATSCKKMREASAIDHCLNCEHLGQIQSPIKLAFGTPDPTPWPFRSEPAWDDRIKDHYDSIQEYTEDGWEVVVPWKIENFTVIDGGEDGETQVYMICNGKHIWAASKDLMTKDDRMRDVFASKGIAILADHTVRRVRALMNAWVHKLQQSKQTSRGTEQLGWVGNKFYYGGWLYGAKGDEATRLIDTRLHEIYMPHGTLQPWQACADHILSQPREASWAIIASAFAAPLLKFTGLSGALLSIVSQDSGTGKSTAMQIAAAVWGNPKSSMASLDDTALSVANRLGVLNTLPSYWDEVREKEQVQRFIKNVFRLSQGRERTRLNASIQQRKAGEWDTLLVIASNDPVKDHLTQKVSNTDAGTARIFELRAKHIPSDGMSDGAARQFYKQIKTNYGHAGQQYAEWLGKNKDEAEKRVERWDSTLSTKLNTGQDERFWVATIASLIAGAELATELEICHFDMPAFKRYLIGKLLDMRKVKKQEGGTPLERAVGAVQRYMHDRKDQTILARKIPTKARGGEIIHEPERGGAVARICVDDKVIRLLRRDFEHWYYHEADMGAGQSHVIENLLSAGATITRGSVEAGTKRPTPGRPYCIDIPYNKKAFAGLTPN